MGWNDSEENHFRRRNTGKYFKLEEDGQTERLVILTEPEEQEKDGQNGPWVAYQVDLWNVTAGKRQSWDMGSSAFKGLVGLKKAIGKDKLHASELVVVRNGAKGDTKTSYTFVPDGKVTPPVVDAIVGDQRVNGGPWPFAPRGQAAPVVDRPFHDTTARTDLDGGLYLATSLAELQAAFLQAWGEAGNDATQAHLQAVYDKLAPQLQAAAAAAAAPAAPVKRAPTF